MTTSYLNSLGALFSATGPMAPSVNFDSILPCPTTRIELPGLQFVLWPSGFAFTSTAHSGNTVARLDFKYTISGDDATTTPRASKC